MRRLQLSVVCLTVALAACGSVADSDDPDAGGGGCDPACDTNATCTASKTCECNDGYTGDGQTCTDIDECATGNGGCDPHAQCTNTPGGRSCACDSGYEGDGLLCSNINECLTDNGGCSPDAICNDLDGSFLCECKQLFVGDGVTCKPAWEETASFPGVQLEFGFGAKGAAVGKDIFFGADGNVGDRYMRRYDTTTPSISGPLPLPDSTISDDFCACGFTDVFVSTGSEIYMLGNEGARYVPSDNSWHPVSGYIDVRRGEAAGVFVDTTGTLLMIGGRGPLDDALRMTTPGEAFSIEPGTLPKATDRARAWSIPGSGVVYLAGGSGAPRAMLSHTAGSGGWTTHADAPIVLSSTEGMGDFAGRIWVATTDAFVFYNPSTNEWDRQVATPGTVRLALNANGDTWAFTTSGSDTVVYRLLAIE